MQGNVIHQTSPELYNQSSLSNTNYSSCLLLLHSWPKWGKQIFLALDGTVLRLATAYSPIHFLIPQLTQTFER